MSLNVLVLKELSKPNFMKSAFVFFREKVMPGIFALLFVTALLLISVLLERRHLYF